ncbi:FBP domain-containing protein [Rugosimonospora acidiphila]|uniref:FBP domain-containing protein n=1 Tax=Rugosimonospora acidiphila TaxID=556531 RepID=A0ABP9SLA3_9ACTN
MDPISEAEIRGSFLNCSKGDAARIKLPTDFLETPWELLDFFGWTDPSAPQRAAIVLPSEDGVQAIMLRKADRAFGGRVRSGLCQACLTSHPGGGVALFTASCPGPSGRVGNSVGEYLCADLACSLYLRGTMRPRPGAVRVEETLALDEKVERAMRKLRAFARRVADTPATVR